MKARIAVATILMLVPHLVLPGQAQTRAVSIDELVAPIALYPDALIAQILLSAANPAQVQEFDRWLTANNKALSGSNAPGRGCQGGLRGQPRRARPLPAGRQTDGVGPELDEDARWNLRRQPGSDLRQHPEVAAPGAVRGDVEDDPAAGGDDPDDLVWRTGDHHRAGQSAGRLRAAVQPAGRLHAGAEHHHGRHPGRRRRLGRGRRGWRHRLHGRSRDQLLLQPVLLRRVRMVRRRPTCTTTDGTTTWITARMRAKTGWTTAKTSRKTAATGPAIARKTARIAHENGQENRTDRQENRTDRGQNAQQQRTDRQQSRSDARASGETQRGQSATATQSAQGQRTTRSGSAEARGYSGGTRTQGTQQRSGSSDAFSGYSRGSSQRSSSARGQRSRSSSGGRSGGRRRRRSAGHRMNRLLRPSQSGARGRVGASRRFGVRADRNDPLSYVRHARGGSGCACCCHEGRRTRRIDRDLWTRWPRAGGIVGSGDSPHEPPGLPGRLPRAQAVDRGQPDSPDAGHR